MTRWYVHPNVLIRIASTWGTCLHLALAVWTLAYALLPDGIARGGLPVQRLPFGQGHTLLAVLIPIFLYNLVIAGGLVAVASLYRVSATPLGLIATTINWALYGLLLGSDSLGIPIGHKLAPSLTTLVDRSGLEELTANALIAATTTGLFLYRQHSWLDWTTTRERRWSELRVPRLERLVLAAAIPLLEVLPHHRGRGIGRELMQRLLGRLDHLYMIDVTCDPELVPFYSALGFARTYGALLRNYAHQAGATGRT